MSNNQLKETVSVTILRGFVPTSDSLGFAILSMYTISKKIDYSSFNYTNKPIPLNTVVVEGLAVH